MANGNLASNGQSYERNFDFGRGLPEEEPKPDVARLAALARHLNRLRRMHPINRKGARERSLPRQLGRPSRGLLARRRTVWSRSPDAHSEREYSAALYGFSLSLSSAPASHWDGSPTGKKQSRC